MDEIRIWLTYDSAYTFKNIIKWNRFFKNSSILLCQKLQAWLSNTICSLIHIVQVHLPQNEMAFHSYVIRLNYNQRIYFSTTRANISHFFKIAIKKNYDTNKKQINDYT